MLVLGCGEADAPLYPRAWPSQLEREDAQQARRLISDYGCIACHRVPGVKGPSTNVGPPLAQIALRSYIAGVLPNTPENMVRWLLDPPAIDPRTAMPNIGMTTEDAQAVAAYLLAQR